MTKNFRKVLSILLALSLVLGLCPDAAKAVNFSDKAAAVPVESAEAVVSEKAVETPSAETLPAADEETEEPTQPEIPAQEDTQPEATEEPAQTTEPVQENPQPSAPESPAEPANTVKPTEPVRPTVPELDPLPITLPEITEVAMPKQSFTGTANGVDVYVSAPEGAFPEGTLMVLKAVDAAAVENQVRKVVDGDITKMLAVDISFVDASGKEIEPLKAIDVSMTSAEIDTQKAAIVHIPDSGDAQLVKGVELSANKVSFKSEMFSVYVVVETGEDARLFVNFVQYGGETKTMMINQRQIPQIDQYIFDPGANQPADSVFLGWTTEENYTADTEAKTVAEVREEIKTKLNAGVTDGTEVTYYAMVFKAYEVIYWDEKGILVEADQILIQYDDTTTKPEHKVTLDYTPYPPENEASAAQFVGWQQIQPEVTGTEVIYKVGDSFALTENVYILAAKTEFGYWLSFDENLSGASYTEPQFVELNGKPSAPATPTRAGYTFDGWYTEDADKDARDGQVAGEAFNFNAELTANTTVYAKWTKAATASYKVLVWLQNLAGNGYDYSGTTITVNNATVGNNTYQITSQGSGNGAYARVYTSNTQHQNLDSFTGFHFANADSQTAVAAEGNTVINVYYDRNEYTLTFQKNNYGWTTIKTITALYGQYIGNQFPIVGTDGK